MSGPVPPAAGAAGGDGRVLLADKPAGRTSHDLVADAKREYGSKAGHAGTLDPFATGLLIVLLGRHATREQARFMHLPKTYRVVARLGATSSTVDTEGEITITGKLPPPDLSLPIGQICQRPPAFSAVRVQGERAYRRARRGERIEMPPRLVDVHRFDLVHREPERAEFEIECSSGTYVRSLIADLEGDAYCEQLRRTRIGPFTVEEAAEGPILGLEEALARLQAFEDERVRRDG